MVPVHLSALNTAASRYSELPAFKLPQTDLEGRVTQWSVVTYRQFQDDVNRFARHWADRLLMDGVCPKSVVGLWLSGMAYTDVLHIYGLSKAGYIPQLCSLRLDNADIIYQLLHHSAAKALIVDPSKATSLSSSPVPVYHAITTEEAALSSPFSLPEFADPLPSDTALIFHTSGSTSGSPKLVPCSYRWLKSMFDKSYQVLHPKSSVRKDVISWMGSMCHIAQNFMLSGALQHGSCFVQPTTLDFSSQELVEMVKQCDLNRLNLFATYLSRHIRAARTDCALSQMLSGLDQLLSTGLPLPREDEEWAYSNGLPLRNVFGNTECGGMLLSVGSDEPQENCNPRLLRSLDGMAYSFVPIDQPHNTETSHQSTTRMLELVVCANSLDCPDESLCGADGCFRTGDLFNEVKPGHYIFRGRNDDWIKSENSLRCDTRAIEDNVRATCAHLISDCVVVGSGRPSPVLFVEPLDEAANPTKLSREIISRTRQFHVRRYIHERITSPDMVLIVRPGSLPRTATKGNIRRQLIEEEYKDRLDTIFAKRR
ncbi:hypothetical protein HGRIS_000679 [Hohenbuehelia grisea]|uniref:AMP-dependent synthetase/ligase domain-containing protein n=1 Tax=Hohenbuehelia grisea TaxID=104357 RepID=A0ABR3JSC4_9AGAR